MRAELPRPLQVASLAIALPLVLGINSTSHAQVSTPVEPRTTLIVFADRQLEDDAWIALFDAMRNGLQDVARVSPAMAGPTDIVRGDKIGTGLLVDKSVTVYLHGNCTLQPSMRPLPSEPITLGWVLRVNRRIEPFIHVDCGAIDQMVARLALGMSRARRTDVMSEAITRVILHELVHVATQSPKHTTNGLSKAEFAVSDLLAEDQTLRRYPPKAGFAWKSLR
jgi:hypothetical protein